jgi:hypothetical protein
MYWVLSDFKPDLGYDDLPTYGIFQDELYEWINKSASRFVIVVSDACRENIKPRESAVYIRTGTSDERLAWLFACDKGQYARYNRKSPYTSHLTEALAQHVHANNAATRLADVKARIQGAMDVITGREGHARQTFWIIQPTVGGRLENDPMQWTIFKYNGQATPVGPVQPAGPTATYSSTTVLVDDNLGNELAIPLPAGKKKHRLMARFATTMKRIIAALGAS